MSDFPGLFKANFNFKDFSRKTSKFKYFSSLCKPCYINPFTAIINASNTPGGNTAILMLLWCNIYNFIQNHNHCRDLHQIFPACLRHLVQCLKQGAQWLSGRVLDSRPRGRGFEPHRRHCVVSLSKNIYPSLVPVQPRKTHPFITERLLMGRKESNKQTNKTMSEIMFSSDSMSKKKFSTAENT